MHRPIRFHLASIQFARFTIACKRNYRVYLHRLSDDIRHVVTIFANALFRREDCDFLFLYLYPEDIDKNACIPLSKRDITTRTSSNLASMNALFLYLCVCFVALHGANFYRDRKAGCPPLRLKNGKVKTRPRTFAQFMCNKGYILAGERISKCILGQWDSTPPLCVRPNCQRVQNLKNGVVYRSHRGGVLNFYCGANYVLQGPRMAYCVDMKWDTHLPSCLPTNATPSMSCDFETNDICGWSHDLNHNFDWTRRSNRTPSGHLATGPSYDHTKGPGGNGYYMYIEASTKNVNDTARLISPMYKKLSNNTCLEFYYHMYGSGIGQLRVYVKKINDSWTLKPEDAVFWKSGNHGNEWLKAFVELGSIDDQFQVIFEGVRGISFVSDIAIDDVKIVENCVTNLVTTTEEEIEGSTFQYDSCSNRCNTSSLEISCSCEENCVEQNTCCPDYIVTCILGGDADTTDDSTETEIELTTEMNNVVTTTQAVQTTANLTRKFTFLPLLPTLTTAMVARPTLRVETTTTKSVFTKVLETTTTPRPLPPTTSRPRKVSTTQKYYFNDMLTVPDKVTESDVVLMTEPPTAIFKEYVPDENDRLLSEKTAPVHEQPRPTNTTTVIAVLTVCFTVVGVLGMVFLVKRYASRNCVGVRRMRSGNGDSQSDVRFLTGDEVLDFKLARPSSDY